MAIHSLAGTADHLAGRALSGSRPREKSPRLDEMSSPDDETGVVMMLDWTKPTEPPPNMLAIDYARDAAKEQDGIFGDIKVVMLYTTHRWARLDPR